MNKIKIRKPNDFHHHLRDGNLLPFTTHHCFKNFKNVVVMPNLLPPIITIHEASEYRERIMKYNTHNGNPLMTLYFHKNLKKSELQSMKNHPYIIGIKYYHQFNQLFY